MSQSFEILFFALIAGYLFYRLWSVLGQTPEAPPERSTSQADIIDITHAVNPPSRDTSSVMDLLKPAAAKGFDTLRSHQPEFQLEEFLRGAMSAFRMVIQAFAQGDRQTLRQLLDDTVYQQFSKALDNREKKYETMESQVDELQIERIDDIQVDQKDVHITVRFKSLQMLATINHEGIIVDNPARLSVPMIDIWTFRRNINATDPNWALSATRIEGD